MLGNTRFISRVEHDTSLVRCAHSWDIMFNTRNKSGISAHPCIILYIIYWYFNQYELAVRHLGCINIWIYVLTSCDRRPCTGKMAATSEEIIWISKSTVLLFTNTIYFIKSFFYLLSSFVAPPKMADKAWSHCVGKFNWDTKSVGGELE
jgi:hypothetical protein